MSSLRSVPDALDSDVVSAIDQRLDGVERDHDVVIPWAIESGSRAWGFPSPDSDYDCRFFFLRRPSDYAALWPPRDVIETPLDAVFDVNGWDLAKTLRLLVGGNATVVEWLRSPIVYRGDPAFRDELLALADAVADPAKIGRHYLHVARAQRLQAAPGAPLKRFFYVLRPAAALRWMRVHEGSAVPPMDLATLLHEAQVDDRTLAAADELVARKSLTRELGTGDRPSVLEDFVREELALAEARFDGAATAPTAKARDAAEAFFRRTTGL
ncbi:nucleotidyltransferase [Curtobacterium sp. Leaf261]|nr:nucleotidyltransferase [Curtobacterium sp. Leaf261]